MIHKYFSNLCKLFISNNCQSSFQIDPVRNRHHDQWWIQDFPLGGAEPLGGTNLRCGHFLAKTYVKTKELDPVRGGTSSTPLDLPMVIFNPIQCRYRCLNIYVYNRLINLSISNAQIPDVKLHQMNKWNTNMDWTYAMCVNSRNQVCVQGRDRDIGFYIRWVDRNKGRLIKETKCQCEHDNMLIGCICEHPVDPDVIIETCWKCSKIRSYNMNTGESKDIYVVHLRDHLLSCQLPKSLRPIHSLQLWKECS